MDADLDAIASAVLDDPANVEPLPLLFLLHYYRATDRADVGDALGRALAAAHARHRSDRSTRGRAAWLTLFVDAAALSDDERLLDAASALVDELAAEWPRSGAIDETAASIDACLRAAVAIDAQAMAPRAIDELERVIGAAYRPGGGIAHTTDAAARVPGTAADHVAAAAALLTAHDVSGRLPYSMLAEELMQGAPTDAARPFDVDCGAARVLCRLAALHDDPDYRQAAVVTPDADYRRDAERILRRWADGVADRGAGAAIYGLALIELGNRVIE